MSDFKERVSKHIGDLKGLIDAHTEENAPPVELIEALRKVGDRLFYMAKDRVDSIIGTLKKALEELDRAVELAGGADSEQGRQVMNLVRRLDGFGVVTTVELRSAVDGFTRPSSLQFVASLPKFGEKQIDDLMEGLYDLADDLEGGDEA